MIAVQPWLTRTAMMLGLVCVMSSALVIAPTTSRAETASAFMQRVANELVAANRSRSPQAFASVLRKHGDLPGMGLIALGSYEKALSKSDRPLYYNGVVNFISKYAASESGKYAIDRATVLGQGEEDATGAWVETRVWLRGGESYDVRWRVMRSGGTYKVRDAVLLGSISSVELMGDLFQKYIAENGGSSQALILALNRYGGGSGTASTAAAQR